MPNKLVRAAVGGVSDYPHNPQPNGFVRNLLMRWSSRAKYAPATEKFVQESFMNQHVDRRALLASSAAATAALAVVVSAQEAHAGETPTSGALTARIGEHPDAELFRLESEMEVASARLKKIERSQSRKSKKAEKAAGPRPLHPHDWKAPAMPDDLSEIHQSALQKATVADLKHDQWRPAPVAAWQEQVDRERDLVKAEWDRFCERLAEQNRLLGYNVEEAEFNAACDHEWQIGMSIFAVPAHTIDGMMVKLRASDTLRLEDFANANEAYASIAADIRRLAGEGAKISSPLPDGR
ncbi:hypothetical protein EOA75_24825 [Mesorhizobium sp. M1A.F.Ca.IN.022.07.1.1]|uniref:hypothetical protein n=1 Tax=Mesorhizobium sp. M1A.F.Ca.IN.022.07.1.1 TaxID=2496767 RepID=UPI000FC9C376|nr:hypothetical protein [Mesorhizobium sp. M1A.F.Ca.IN.022.07.1.1]RUV87981.1 hypothetical protein EOA75_24825 [Mesorhizobium sp. M1A.F.Ca.IN.022.07.1.1]